MKFKLILFIAIFSYNFALLASNGESERLKYDLISLTSVKDPQEIQRILEKIRGSHQLDDIITFGLSEEEYGNIFNILKHHATLQDLLLIDKLITYSTMFRDSAPKNILPTISHIIDLADAASHDEYSESTEKIKNYLYKLLTKDHSYLINEDKFFALMKILSWKNLQNYNYTIEMSIKEALKSIVLKHQQKILQNLDKYYSSFQNYGMLKEIANILKDKLQIFAKIKDNSLEALTKSLKTDLQDKSFEKWCPIFSAGEADISGKVDALFQIIFDSLSDADLDIELRKSLFFNNCFSKYARLKNRLYPFRLFFVKNASTMLPLKWQKHYVQDLFTGDVPVSEHEASEYTLAILNYDFSKLFLKYGETEVLEAIYKDLETVFKSYPSILFRLDLTMFSELRFTPESLLEKEGIKEKLPLALPKMTICNFKGYEKGIEGDELKCDMAKPIFLDERTPISFVAFLPEGKVKAIMTEVYGGSQANAIKEKIMTPLDLSTLDEYLLSKNIAIVKLNLIDLLELNVQQFNMSEDVFKRIILSINKYFEEFNNPEHLHANLAELKGKPNFLSGTSFGALIAARYAQSFPHTFAGYITFSGSLNPRIADYGSSDWRSGSPSFAWLDPIRNIGKIKDPFLIFHNFDDNNVPLEAPLSFYEEAKKQGVGNMIRLMILPQGNPLSLGKDLISKGHFLSFENTTQRRVGDHMVRFMTKGPSVLPAASDLYAHMYRMRLAGKSAAKDPSAETINNVLEKIFSGIFKSTDYSEALESFLEKAYTHYEKSSRPEVIDDKIWEKEYQTQARIEALLATIDKENILSLFAEFMKLQKYDPDYVSQAMKKSIAHLAYGFAVYLKERYGFTSATEELARIIKSNQKIYEYFIRFDAQLYSLRQLKFFLRQLFEANPELFARIVPKNMQTAHMDFEGKAHRALNEKLKTKKEIITKVWSEAFKASQIELFGDKVLSKFYNLADAILADAQMPQKNLLALDALSEELLERAVPWLSYPKYKQKIIEKFEQMRKTLSKCSSEACTVYLANTILSYALIKADENLIKENLLIAARLLSKRYPKSQQEKGLIRHTLGGTVVAFHLSPMINRLLNNDKFKPIYINFQNRFEEFKNYIDKNLFK